MRLHIIAVGSKTPRWAELAIREYSKRFPPQCPVSIKLVSQETRTRSANLEQLKRREYQSLRAQIPKGALTIAMDEGGKHITSSELATSLEHWLLGQKHVAFLIGGADGLDARAFSDSAQTWALSSLTLPHVLARVVLLEQLYRAWSILSGSPYHRN